MNDIQELRRQGLSICAIAAMTGFDRETVRRYLADPERQPRYGPRPKRASPLDGFKTYIEERLSAAVWNAVVLLRELREHGYTGGYTILKDYLQPKREASRTTAVRRFETPPGGQAQVDWGHLGTLQIEGVERKLSRFTFTLGYSRMMMAEVALDQKLGTVLRMHEEAFRQLGGVPDQILYDRMKTVWVDIDERGEIVWHPVFLDFTRYWGFTPRLCRPYRAQTKGKVESGIKYVRRNFLCGLLGHELSGLPELNARLREWLHTVAHERVHGTTHEPPRHRWAREREHLHPLNGRPPYAYIDEELRRVARDAYVCWRGSRYSVPWSYVGKEVFVRERGSRVEVHYGTERIAIHERVGQHQVVTQPEHHRGIPLGSGSRNNKILIHLRESAPAVEVRPLITYENAVAGGLA